MIRTTARAFARGLALHGVAALGLSCVALVFDGCSSGDATVLHGATLEATSTLQRTEVGELSLQLVTSDSARYRLVTALFDIERSGVTVLSLNSDDDPDAEQLTAELEPGSYELRLRAGWAIRRLEDDGGAEPVQAALLSPNPVAFSIRNDRLTTVAFTFTTSAGVLTFGNGALSIRLGFRDPGSLASCDVVGQTGCESGQHCLFGDDAGKTFCATPGTLSVGSPCSSQQCAFGAQCLSLNLAEPEASVCTALCNPASPPFGCDCRGLSFDDRAGVCGPLPAGACDLLKPASCPEGQACQYPGGSFGVCGTPGTSTQGASCLGEECAAGFDCYGDQPDFGFSGTCYRFCDLQNPDCDFCFDVGTGSVGRCFL